MNIVLASASPRRRQLLTAAGFDVEIQRVDVVENMIAGEPIPTMVRRLARLKSQHCQEQTRAVVTADTMVCLHGQGLGKPSSLAIAKAMLHSLSGQTHQVYTGVCVRLADTLFDACVRTDVHFRTLSEAEIDHYLRHHEVLDKAGAYAIQEGAASFIDRIDGPLDNVIGLPVHTTHKLLQHLSYPFNRP